MQHMSLPVHGQDYDTHNILVVDGFQRISSIVELVEKIKEVKENKEWLKRIKKDFLERIPTEKGYYEEFDKKLTMSL